ncbi:hypothetical protein ACFFRE_09400 [Aciditerrimonas ferrireducens]|uniref:Uncharacterized protein n=1 Tax=Aciditerrimonas ferrireducens TaxID=667306 RepID=A0ABV6C3V1_9ACTN
MAPAEPVEPVEAAVVVDGDGDGAVAEVAADGAVLEPAWAGAVPDGAVPDGELVAAAGPVSRRVRTGEGAEPRAAVAGGWVAADRGEGARAAWVVPAPDDGFPGREWSSGGGA